MRAAPLNSVDLVLCAPQDRQLAVLLVRDKSKRARERWSLPWAPLDAKRAPDHAAASVAMKAAGARASWIEQAGAFTDAKRHPGGAAISISYVGVMPMHERGLLKGAKWFPVSKVPLLPPRHREMIDAAVAQLRERMDRAPVAFRLLGPVFTLSDLQEVYELLLGRRLHKASFRRALQAAFLVAPTDEWRSEGRGRPAQLFRYAPRKRRGGRGGVRFELLGG